VISIEFSMPKIGRLRKPPIEVPHKARGNNRALTLILQGAVYAGKKVIKKYFRKTRRSRTTPLPKSNWVTRG
jgi:hypothetical protein